MDFNPFFQKKQKKKKNKGTSVVDFSAARNNFNLNPTNVSQFSSDETR